ncbi:hypothetical protein NRB20_53360 [Nocardia sp. RB20]|uniref:Cellobiose transport system substrate-binding protein n=1 Tax=Nocardia macrotermitis TaxID=2585198 RepID=A0A7K0D8W3_9NOCA|nr:hypothetical protein [Nocardia macrotermitis]
MRHILRKVLITCAVLAVGTSGISGCAGGGSGITLTVATFGEFGYENLVQEYQRAHPGITVTLRKTGQGGPYHQDLLTKLAAGSGLSDVVAIEEGHLSDIADKSGKFNDLATIGPKDVTPARWLPWKYQEGKSKDGKWIGYGTDIGPLAMCYRKDMFAAAGLPTDPDAVKPLFATWDSYFAAGRQYVAATHTPWFDSGSQVFNSMVNQLDTGYFGTDDALTISSNPPLKSAWDKVTAAIVDGESAKLTSFSPEWQTGFKQSAFATTVCPGWMLGVIKENAGPGNSGKWAVTEAFPGGGGNWGGSFLTVPKQSKHPEEAAALAAWLTAPEQQIKAFGAKGPFPSQVQALRDPALLSATDDYFGGVHSGALFAAQAMKVGHAQYKGPKDGQIQESVVKPALTAVEQGTSPADGWKQVVEGAEKLVGK